MKRILWVLRVLFARLSNFFLIWSESNFKNAFNNHFGKFLNLFGSKSRNNKNDLKASRVPEVLTRDIDFLLDSTSKPCFINDHVETNKRWIWATPVFNAGSGGHHDIFMLSSESQNRGIRNVIGLVNGSQNVNILGATKVARESYGYENIEFAHLFEYENESSDLVIATGWQTFASAMHLPSKKYAYLIQDFEPNFYPPSIQAVLAEATYKKSVPCLTAGPWLAKKMREDYGLESQHFELGYDPEHYSENKFAKERDVIVVYYRPGTARRASELMLEVLRHAASKISDYEVHFVGGKPEGLLPFRHVSHGQLTHNELGALYGRAVATCLFSLTNTSLVPVEALACGSNIFTNKTENNIMNLNGANVNFFDIDIPKMAHGLSDLVNITSSNNYDDNRSSVIGREWSVQKKQAVDYLESIT